MSGIKNDFKRVSTLIHDVFLIAIKKIRTRLPNFLYCLRQPSSANPVWNPHFNKFDLPEAKLRK